MVTRTTILCGITHSHGPGAVTRPTRGRLVSSDDIVREEPERAWPMILSLIGASRSDQFLAILAAGPLENLLCEHGEAFIERVEQLAARDPAFSARFSRRMGLVTACRRFFSHGFGPQSAMKNSSATSAARSCRRLTSRSSEWRLALCSTL